MGVNYGQNRVRYPHPVPCDAEIRAATTLLEVRDMALDRILMRSEVVVEIRGVDKPALVVESLAMFVLGQGQSVWSPPGQSSEPGAMKAVLCRELGPPEASACRGNCAPGNGPRTGAYSCLLLAALISRTCLVISGQYQERPELPFIPGIGSRGRRRRDGS